MADDSRPDSSGRSGSPIWRLYSEYGRFGATDEDIEAAARRAQAHEFVRNLPNGYDTLVGERGVTSSPAASDSDSPSTEPSSRTRTC
jgi:hypothetical protein